MTKLNEKTNKTEKVIHLMVTSLCDRNCPYCCNMQYDLNSIPYVTDEELRKADTICITGGEPFKYANPSNIVYYYRRKYPNIKKFYVYTNALEFCQYIKTEHIIDAMLSLVCIDGLDISIKNELDKEAFVKMMEDEYLKRILREKNFNNRLYVFDNLYEGNPDGFTVIHREWQEDFVPCDDSIFRRV